MAHDALCYWSTHIELVPEALGGYSRRQQERLRDQQDALCQCDLIAKVRTDERAKSLT
jgi:hypothetical protein